MSKKTKKKLKEKLETLKKELKKQQKNLKKKLKIYPNNRDYPENSQIWYGSPPHHYKYPDESIKDEAQELKSKNRIIKIGKSRNP